MAVKKKVILNLIALAVFTVILMLVKNFSGPTSMLPSVLQL